MIQFFFNVLHLKIIIDTYIKRKFQYQKSLEICFYVSPSLRLVFLYVCYSLIASLFFIVVFGYLRGLNWGLIAPEKISFASGSARVCYIPGNTSAPLEDPRPLFLFYLRADNSHQETFPTPPHICLLHPVPALVSVHLFVWLLRLLGTLEIEQCVK